MGVDRDQNSVYLYYVAMGVSLRFDIVVEICLVSKGGWNLNRMLNYVTELHDINGAFALYLCTRCQNVPCKLHKLGSSTFSWGINVHKNLVVHEKNSSRGIMLINLLGLWSGNTSYFRCHYVIIWVGVSLVPRRSHCLVLWSYVKTAKDQVALAAKLFRP